VPSAPQPPARFVTLSDRPIGIAGPASDRLELLATDPEFELLDCSSFRWLELLAQATTDLTRVVGEVIPVPNSCCVDVRATLMGRLALDGQMSTKSVDKVEYVG
jgi:hypothetical protein